MLSFAMEYMRGEEKILRELVVEYMCTVHVTSKQKEGKEEN